MYGWYLSTSRTGSPSPNSSPPKLKKRYIDLKYIQNALFWFVGTLLKTSLERNNNMIINY